MTTNVLTGFVYQRKALESLPNLTFLHLYELYDRLPITAQEIAHEVKHLHRVGRQQFLWDVVRVGNDEMLFPWNLSKKWKVEEDFPDEDSAWLLRCL
jgi:hypothetical protein